MAVPRKSLVHSLLWLLAGVAAIAMAWQLDNRVDAALDATRNPSLQNFAWWCSKLGEGWVPGLAGIFFTAIFLLRRRPGMAAKILFVTLACEITGLAGLIIRVLAGRTRPTADVPQGFYGVWHDGHWISGQYQFSAFPSGHSATVVGLATAAWLVKRGWGAAAAVFALFVMWSRIALQAHHLSDVVASTVLAIPLAILLKKTLLPFLEFEFAKLFYSGPNAIATSDLELEKNSFAQLDRQIRNLLSKYGLAALTLLTFFLLLGNRPLNEPDEGRYAEVAREMIETGNWLVPHFWFMPHLDKPPLTYWLVATSMEVFGQNEWAVRLPVALAGISGVWAAFLLGRSLGGRRVGIWSALILQSALLYWAMARMLTTDIFLTQFIAWAIYFLWRSWRAAEKSKTEFFAWHLAAWAAIALGFMTKGPLAFAIPVVSMAALMFSRRRNLPGIIFAGLFAGFLVFLILAAPWFLFIFRQVPESADYMILGQVAGHLLGTAIKNRDGSHFYFFGILALGLLPWSLLLGWLWRRAFWRSLDPKAKEGWLLLNVWAIFTFTLFSFSHAKLPPYILPMFPALAVMLAWKFFGTERADESVPKIAWQIVLATSLAPPAIFPIAVYFIFHDPPPLWLDCQGIIALAVLIFVFISARKWKLPAIAGATTGLALLSLVATIAEFPLFPFNLKSNEPLDQVGLALRTNFQPGDAIVCWGRLPQGLPFYSGGLISATNRPYFCDMDTTQVPLEFTGNRQRLGSLYLDDAAAHKLLATRQNVLVVSFGHIVEDFETNYTDIRFHLIIRAGPWSLYSRAPDTPAPHD
jgi:4-amino-4-deoxy-L-arabinose transferase-like glycosyltransferase/membrane-associated phospholipid phosphatase